MMFMSSQASINGTDATVSLCIFSTFQKISKGLGICCKQDDSQFSVLLNLKRNHEADFWYTVHPLYYCKFENFHVTFIS